MEEKDLLKYFSYKSNERLVANVKKTKDDLEKSEDIKSIHNYKYIAVNKYRYTTLHIDVDIKEANLIENYYLGFDNSTFDNHNIPLPNITVHDGIKSFHSMWFFEKPFPLNATLKTLRYYNYIRKQIIMALNGDPSCSPICYAKNPFYKWNQTRIFHFSTFEFGDLDIGYKQAKNNFGNNFVDNINDGRNRRLFNFILSTFKKYNSIGYEELFDIAMSFSDENFSIPLPKNEISSVCKSVLRNGNKYSHRDVRNYGAMGLQQLIFGKNTNESERVKEIRKRQSTGANYTNKIRKEKSIQKLHQAIENIKCNNGKLSINEISKLSSLNRKTVSKYISITNNNVVFKLLV